MVKIKISRAVLLGIISGLCWFAQGFGQANFGNSSSLPIFLTHFPSLNQKLPGLSEAEKSHRSLMVGVVTSVYELGLAGGGLSTYFIGDRLGRKITAYVAAVSVIIGVVIEASAYSLGQLIVGRIVAGLGIGAFTATVPAWVSESVAPRKRGPLVFIGGGFGISGVACMSWIMLGLYLHQKSHEIAWRLPLALQGIVAVLVIVAVSTQPESPRALIRKGKQQQAYDVMRKIRSDDPVEAVDEEFSEMLQAYQVETATKDKSPWSFNQHKQFRRTMSAIVLSGLCQMAGINLITFYGSIIFENDIGLSATKSRISLAGLQTWQALCAFSAMWFVKRFGRRNLLLGGSATMCICFCCCAGLASANTTDTSYGILAFDAIQLAAFPIGLFLNPFLVGSEIAGLLCRSAVLACVSCMNWLCNFAIALATPIGFTNIGYQYYIVYVATNAALFIYVFLFIPETGGLTLEEVDQAYVNSRNPFDIIRCADAIRAAGHVPPDTRLAPSLSKDAEKGSVHMIEDIKRDDSASEVSVH